jgi:hypothetical protein
MVDSWPRLTVPIEREQNGFQLTNSSLAHITSTPVIGGGDSWKEPDSLAVHFASRLPTGPTSQSQFRKSVGWTRAVSSDPGKRSPMSQGVEVAGLYVRDQDEALQFMRRFP